MNFNKIFALSLRHIYLIKGSFPRILDLIYWPTIQIFLWGFISKFFTLNSSFYENTVGIMPTQLNGRVCEMDKIQDIATKNSLFIVEDAAQALGSKYKGQHAGTFGLASDISFFPAKVLGCLGDAGGVLVNDKELYHNIYQIHDHGRDTDGEVKRWGRNSRLDNIQAAILSFKLKSYQKVIERSL